MSLLAYVDLKAVLVSPLLFLIFERGVLPLPAGDCTCGVLLVFLVYLIGLVS